jgi:hypothetical protein
MACVLLLSCRPAAPVTVQAQHADTTASAVRTPTSKRALLVGINDYSASTLTRSAVRNDRGINNLRGAVTDVESAAALLIGRYGFTSENMVLLKDQSATRAAILAKLDELASTARARDVILFYYSGHGSQAFNERSAEPDHRDETIVPADAAMGAHDIHDKDLRRIFNLILDRGARLTVVLDSCHSGSGGREGMPNGVLSRGVKPDPHDKFDGADAGPRPEGRGALILAAAQDSDAAWEMVDSDGKNHGAFSWALARAMRDATPGESATDTFLRAQARLRAERPDQNPVLAGGNEARIRPFLSSDADAVPRRNSLAVQKVIGGRIVLQGGWVNGVTVGSELRSVVRAEIRLVVTGLTGYGVCQARLSDDSKELPAPLVQSGDLFELRAWAAPPSPAMRVAMPTVDSVPETFIRSLRQAARNAGIQWVSDPTAQTPTHLLRTRGRVWELVTREGKRMPFALDADAATLIAALPPDATLFVQVPMARPIAAAIDAANRESSGSIVFVDDPDDADYVLTGRIAEGPPEYAWVRPGVAAKDAHRSGLPPRTTWQTTDSDSGLLFYDTLRRLRRIHGWELLETPPNSAFPYVLAIHHERDGVLIENDILRGGEDYRLSLRARTTPVADVQRRYVYAFLIDSWGRGILLYPASSVENRFPLDPAKLPTEIALQASFVASPPFGVDSYFLLTTDEPLPNPWVLEWDGIRTRKRDTSTPLESILATVGESRSGERNVTSPQWSIQRITIESVAPQ